MADLHSAAANESADPTCMVRGQHNEPICVRNPAQPVCAQCPTRPAERHQERPADAGATPAPADAQHAATRNTQGWSPAPSTAGPTSAAEPTTQTCTTPVSAAEGGLPRSTEEER